MFEKDAMQRANTGDRSEPKFRTRITGRPLQSGYFYMPMVSPLYRRAKRRVLRKVYAGDGVHCPVCNRESRCWIGKRENGTCPSCGSFTRHRLLWLLLADSRGRFERDCHVLYFAPEGTLVERLRSVENVRCTTTDLCAANVDVKADITKLPFDRGTFDAIICSHVLEHVPDDLAAMSELHRVLKPGGEAFVQVPLDGEAALTDEDPTIVDPKERERRFGQHDHVRLYGRDIGQRLRGAGFVVRPEHPVRRLSKEMARRYGLWDDTIYRCIKLSVHQAFSTCFPSSPST